MYYVKTTFSFQFDKTPCVQYLEVPDDLWVSRSVEEKRDGSLGYANFATPEGVNGVFLPDQQCPEKAALFASDGSCKLDSEGEFSSRLITKDEFEAVWQSALRENEEL